MNKVVIMGRLTAAPELRQTQSGVSVVRFTVASNRKFVNKDTKEREADFISCVAWRQTAEFISKYFGKGSMICVDGTLRTGSYQDKNHSDVTHYTTDVLVETVEFCGSKKESEQYTPTNQNGENKSLPNEANSASFDDFSDFEEILSDGDVPF